MSGLSDAKEAALLDSSTLYGQTLYLRLIQWTGAANAGAGQTVNDDGTMPAGCSEVSTGGYAPLSVASTAWAAAEQGSPTIKQVPKTGGADITFTPSGAVEWDICGYCWTTNTSTISSSNLVSSGAIVDQNGDTAVRHVTNATPLVLSEDNPIIERLGDPPVGVDPT